MTLTPIPNRTGATSRTCWLCGHGCRLAITITSSYAGPWRVLGWCRACKRTWEVRP